MLIRSKIAISENSSVSNKIFSFFNRRQQLASVELWKIFTNNRLDQARYSIVEELLHVITSYNIDEFGKG